MTVYNLAGVPFPIDHELFSQDTELINKLKRIADFVEIRSDMREADEAIDALAFSYGKEKDMGKIFGPTMTIPRESLLSFAVVIYAKAFNKSKGRTSLRDKVDKIFSDPDYMDIHKQMIDFRNKVYAHRESDHNEYSIMCYYADNRVRLNTDSNVRRKLFAFGLDKEKIKFVKNLINQVIKFLDSEIENLCHDIEQGLTKEQIEFIGKNPLSHFVLEK